METTTQAPFAVLLDRKSVMKLLHFKHSFILDQVRIDKNMAFTVEEQQLPHVWFEHGAVGTFIEYTDGSRYFMAACSLGFKQVIVEEPECLSLYVPETGLSQWAMEQGETFRKAKNFVELCGYRLEKL